MCLSVWPWPAPGQAAILPNVWSATQDQSVSVCASSQSKTTSFLWGNKRKTEEEEEKTAQIQFIETHYIMYLLNTLIPSGFIALISKLQLNLQGDYFSIKKTVLVLIHSNQLLYLQTLMDGFWNETFEEFPRSTHINVIWWVRQKEEFEKQRLNYQLHILPSHPNKPSEWIRWVARGGPAWMSV